MAGHLLLGFAVIAGALTLNAHRPIRRYQVFVFPSFIAGWLTSELVLQLLALELAAAVGFTARGALRDVSGQLGLAILAVVWGFGLWLWWQARGTTRVLTEALRIVGELPSDATDVPPSIGDIAPALRGGAALRVLYPFARSDRAVRLIRNLRYAEGAGSRHLLDVYAPAAGVTNAPVLVQVHGGGWFTGDKRQQAMPLVLHMARCGWVCVTPNYRLSPGATFPDHLIDLKLALRWVREHIAQYGGDPEFIAVTGGSAGGHLSALLALTPNQPEYQPGFEQVDTKVRACVPLYGVYDFIDRHGHQRHGGLRNLLRLWVLKKDFAREREAFERASPMSHVGPHAPPFFVIHGTHDNMASVEDARAFVALLRERSPGPVLYAELHGAHHAFEIFHSTRTAHVVHAIARFLRALHARYRGERAAVAPEAAGDGDDAALTGSIALG